MSLHSDTAHPFDDNDLRVDGIFLSPDNDRIPGITPPILVAAIWHLLKPLAANGFFTLA